MTNIKKLIDLIVQEIATNTEKSIRLREDRIIDKLLDNKDHKNHPLKFFGKLLIWFLGCLLFLYFLLSMVSFFLFDVIFFEPKLYTTSQGTTVITQPCGIEQAFFLHNSASGWTDTGIDIVKGDFLEISYSGSFYSSLRNQAEASVKRVPLKYPWFTFQRNNKASSNITNQFCMYDSIEDGAAIGDFLCMIGSQMERKYMHQINNKRNKFTAERSGTLQVSVNDIYIPDTTTLKSIMPTPVSVFDLTQKEEILNRLEFDDQHKKYKDSLLIQIKELQRIDSIQKSAHFMLSKSVERCEQCHRYECLHPQSIDTSLIKGAHWNAQNIWYDDNSGEFLVNVRIMRNDLHYSNPIHKFFAIIYRTIDILWRINKFALICPLILLMLLYIQIMLFPPLWKALFNQVTNE